MTIDRPLLPIEEVQNQMQNAQIASEISGNSSTVKPSHLMVGRSWSQPQ